MKCFSAKVVFFVFILLSTSGLKAQEYTIRSFEFKESWWSEFPLLVDGNDVWLGTGQGAYRMVDGSPKLVYTSSNGLVVDTVTQMTKDAIGNHWFLSKQGVSVKTGNAWKYMRREVYNGYLSESVVKGIGEHVWFSYVYDHKNYLVRYAPGAVDSVVFNAPIYVYDIEYDNQDTYWVADYNSVYSFDGTTFDFDTAFQQVADLFVTRDGTVYVAGAMGNSYGVFVRAGSSLYEQLKTPYPQQHIFKIAQGDDNILYFGTGNGLLIFNPETKQWRQIDKSHGLPEGRISDIAVDSDGSVWMSMMGFSGSNYLTVIMYDQSTDPSIVHGKVYDDVNQNGTQDEGEAGVPNHFIRLLPSNGYAISSSDGSFSLHPADGENTISWMGAPYWEKGVTPDSYSFTSPGENAGPFDFGLKRIVIEDGRADISGTATRPGFETYYYVTLRNDGTTPMEPRVTMKVDPDLIFQESNPAVTSANGNQLTWELPTLNAFSDTMIRLRFQVSTEASLGDTLTNIVSLGALALETDLNDNIDTLKQVVTGSFDPNDKLVKEGIFAERYVTMGSSLTYTIRFQNTGTDTAFVVKIKDELDPKLELTSLKVLSYSHPMQYVINDRVITFTFKNIKLPDSTRNEPASHGYVKFQIAADGSIADGTDVQNTALIYFDFNQPVQTNTVSNRFVNVLPDRRATGIGDEHALDVALYPNPATNFLKIVAEKHAGLRRAEIYTLTGEQVAAFDLHAGDEELPLPAMTDGLYVVKIYGAQVYLKKLCVFSTR